MHSDLLAFLRSNAAIAAAASGGIFNEFMPQKHDRFPALVIQMIARVEVESDQDYPAGAKLTESQYQFDTWGESSGEVIEAAEAIDAVLIAFSGAMGSTDIQRIDRTGFRSLGELDGDKQRRRISADYQLTF